MVLPALAAGTRLDILVEAMGRVNFDVAIHDRKGITDKVELISDTGRQELEDWLCSLRRSQLCLVPSKYPPYFSWY